MVYVKNYSAIPLNKSEVLRYSGVAHSSNSSDQLLEECLKEVEGAFKFKVCYSEFSLTSRDGEVNLDSIKFKSLDLAKALSGCDKAIVFAATVGLDIDRLIKKYSNLSPSKALMLSAIGTERVESLCDAFCSEFCKNTNIMPRFSPGYGDLPISYQKDIIKILEAPKLIGLCLSDSLIMSPSKSVTAIVGIGKRAERGFQKNCQNCEDTDCLFRRLK